MSKPVEHTQSAFDTTGRSSSFSKSEIAHAKRQLAASSATVHMSVAVPTAFCVQLPTLADKGKTARIRGRA